MAPTDVQRKYRMLRLRAGDYLLPSNDLTCVWRISRYHEDGSAVSGQWPNETPIVGYFWQASRYNRPIQDLDADALEFYGDDWDCQALMLRTRQEAIDYAVSH